jgi:transposase
MILDPESWMDIRRFRALREAGASIAEIARETGHDWKTVKKYLAADAPASPPAGPSRAGTQPRKIDAFTGVVDTWLRRDVRLRASVIFERLVAEYGFDGHYQRVKMYVAEARPRIAGELAATDENRLVGLHRRFETVPGAQAQVDWGDEGGLLATLGVAKVYSFHMVLSYSRDPFCCFTTSTDLGTFWACHRRAFAHFGGVPGSIVYDRTKTVVRRHVAPGLAVPLHPEAAAFAAHYGFVLDPLAAYRPTGKGRVERQVAIVRDHVLAGRCFDSLAELDAAFTGWLPIRRAQVHRTHGEVIGVRAEVDRAALAPLPPAPYLVTDRHLRRVGKDCRVSFDASLYSVPARQVRPGQRVELRVSDDTVAIHALPGDPVRGPASGPAGQLLATHPRSTRRGAWMVDWSHWDGLPDGHSRSTVIELPSRDRPQLPCDDDPADPADPAPLAALLAHRRGGDIPVARRPLADYAAAAAGEPTRVEVTR